MRIFFLLSCIVFLYTNISLAQDFCHYNPALTKEYPASGLLNPANMRTNENILIPVQLHFVIGDEGIKQDSVLIMQQLNEANEIFSQINIQFQVCNPVNYIYSEEHDNLEGLLFPVYDLGEMYNSPHTLDLFFVKYIEGASGVYSGFGTRDGFVILRRNLVSSATLLHELGHYFNLPHTHNISNGLERANGSNCATAGDKFCDTPADPELSNANVKNCLYTGTEVDDQGNTYNPDVSNFMSYAPASCRNSFSQEQYAEMLWYYNTYLKPKEYVCSKLPDYYVNIENDLTALEKGTNNTVTVKIINFSSVNHTITNLGYKVYLKNDNDITPLSEGILSQDIGAFYTDSVNFDFMIPADLPDDVYSLQIELDPENLYAEISEQNNIDSIDVSIFDNDIAKPDLVIIASGNSTATAGTNYYFDYRLSNDGNFYAENCVYRVYLSDDTLVDGSDIELDGGNFSTMQAGQFYDRIAQVLLTEEAGKSFYVLVTIDIQDEVLESNETNNIAIIPVTTTTASSPKADYYISDYTINNSTVAQGGSAPVRATINNTGPEKHYTLSMATYFSTDNILDESDTRIYMQSQRFYNSTSSDKYFQAPIPVDAQTGNAYLLIVVDDLHQIAETNENNNVQAVPVSITPFNEPYLELADYEMSSLNWAFGSTWTFTGTMKNTGPTYSTGQRFSFFLLKDKDLFDYVYFTGIRMSSTSYDETYIYPQATREYEYSYYVDETKLNPGEYDLVACIVYAPNNQNCSTLPGKVIIGDNIVTSSENKLKRFIIRVFPNPASGVINIETSNEVKKIELLSVGGSVVKTKNSGDLSLLRTQNLNAGVYILRVYSENSVFTEKIILE